ncbi:mRNA surveillance protein pelota [Candidatus Woesearchaeota archaeon]|nr:MAG: mRNA surveillance protein pelota [Candidatus Woesearchaeota archaeon]
MKIVSQNLKTGEVSLVVESSEDLWYLSQLIDPGDIVRGKTVRKVKVTQESEPVKRTMTLALRTERTEYGPSQLRVSGRIVEGPEDIPRGSYHTIGVEPQQKITIVKPKWYSYQLDRLKEAAQGKGAIVLICIFDREDAFFAVLRRQGVERLAHIEGDVQKKRMDVKAKGDFFSQVEKKIAEYDLRMNPDVIVVASPAFWKEEFAKSLKDAKLKKKIVFATCSAANWRAISEVLRRDEVRAALRSERWMREMRAVDEVLERIAKRGDVAYGLERVRDAALAGAIDRLVISDSLISRAREENEFDKIDEIMRATEQSRGEVVIVSSKHEGGKKLDGIGGIAALLRYKVSYG